MDKLLKNAQRPLIDEWTKELNEKGEIVIVGFGTLKRLPRRDGKLNGFGKDGKVRYQSRVKFTPSKILKDKVCK